MFNKTIGSGVGTGENPDEPHRSIKRAEIADTLSSIYIVLARLRSRQCPPLSIDRLLPIGCLGRAPSPSGSSSSSYPSSSFPPCPPCPPSPWPVTSP